MEDLLAERLRPSAQIYAAAVEACNSGSLWEEAVALVADSVARRIEGNSVVLQAALAAVERQCLEGGAQGEGGGKTALSSDQRGAPGVDSQGQRRMFTKQLHGLQDGYLDSL